MVLEVLAPGLHSTIQDAGRAGHGHLGVRRAGAADELAMAAVNLLVGNAPTAPVLEMTLLGGTFAVRSECLVGLTGADMGASVPEQGRALRPGRSHRLNVGTTLRLAGGLDGARTYLAVPGGLQAQEILGSCSTDPLAGFGGLEGRPLREGDVLRPQHVSEVMGEERSWPAGSASSGVATGDGVRQVRVSPGPHLGLLDWRDRDALVGAGWTVSPRSDRVGLRLDGEPVPGAGPSEMVSLPMLPGAVQVPSGGLPLVLMPDAPTIGGYAVPAMVIASDRPILGQLRPGDRLRFIWVDAETARARWAQRWADLRGAAARLA